MKKIFILSVFAFLTTGCIEESYRTEYHTARPVADANPYYDSMTSGYNRDYQKQKQPTGYYTNPSNAGSSKDTGYSVA